MDDYRQVELGGITYTLAQGKAISPVEAGAQLTRFRLSNTTVRRVEITAKTTIGPLERVKAIGLYEEGTLTASVIISSEAKRGEVVYVAQDTMPHQRPDELTRILQEAF